MIVMVVIVIDGTQSHDDVTVDGGGGSNGSHDASTNEANRKSLYTCNRHHYGKYLA